MKTLKQINNAIHAKYPAINLVKDKGYFFIYSDDAPTALKLASLHCTSIYVYSLNQYTQEQWLEQVEFLLNDGYRSVLERCPVYKK